MMLSSTKLAWKLWAKNLDEVQKLVSALYPVKVSRWWMSNQPSGGPNGKPMPKSPVEHWLARHVYKPSASAVREAGSWETKLRSLSLFAINVIRSTPAATAYVGFTISMWATGLALDLVAVYGVPLLTAVPAVVVTLPELPRLAWKATRWAATHSYAAIANLRHLPLREPRAIEPTRQRQAEAPEKSLPGRRLPRLTLPHRHTEGPGRHLGE